MSKSILRKRKTYTKVNIPIDLARQIDILLETTKLGYKSRDEFVSEAIRRLIELRMTLLRNLEDHK